MRAKTKPGRRYFAGSNWSLDISNLIIPTQIGLFLMRRNTREIYTTHLTISFSFS